ncbi:UPF0146 family protein [Halorubrum salinum]|uniref:UPF0146 family protein n=1 Tax=Halorubrum salinum TaxID=767517 RepID=UPI002111B078|nr:UPF0146 family protein [Halorubrum salinum]
MVSSSRRALVEPLSRYGRLIEIGVGDRPGIAIALADRGREVVAIDIEIGDRVRAAADEPRDGTLRVMQGDVLALADESDGSDRSDSAIPRSDPLSEPVDAVYACNLPAELQRPTVALAERLDAACLFTTLGFEEPTVGVRRRSIGGTTLYVAREDRDDDGGTHRR